MTTPYYEDATVQLHHGDCLDVLRSLPDNSVDAVVTDPPYSLSFMGREWDSHETPAGFQAWCLLWATECLRVLKPGGHLLAFGGTRTWHRLACAVEDAGFEVRDSIAWLYGSGFPKSLDVSKAIDKRRTEDAEPVRAVCAFLRDALHENPKSRREIDAHFGTKNVGGHWFTPDSPLAQCPTWDQWLWLKGWLTLPDDMDAEVQRLNARKGAEGDNWHAREVTGTGQAGLTAGSIANFRGAKTFDLTAPATPDAERWQGWGTALKPAFEPVVVARKPLTAGTVAANVLKWGCGALNIDGTRIQPDGGSGEGIGGEAATRGCRVHDVRLVRSADGAMEVAGGPSEVADDLRPALSLGADARGEQPQLAGRRLDGGPLGVSGGVGAEPLTGGSGASTEAATQGVPRAPAGDGAEARPASHAGRDGASPERGEGGQPTRESAPDGLGDSLQGARPDRARPESPTSGERSTAGCTCGADREVTRSGEASADRRYTERGGTNFAPLPGVRGGSPAGRWPANVVLDESQAAELDQQSGESSNHARRDGSVVQRGTHEPSNYSIREAGHESTAPKDFGGASRFFYVARSDPASERTNVAEALAAWESTGPTSTTVALMADALYGTREEELCTQDTTADYTSGVPDAEPRSRSTTPTKPYAGGGTTGTTPTAAANADARFLYTPKADAGERVRVAGIAHPTVKPLALMRWLVRLVTPPGGTVLEPFAGSGTTVEACILEGFHCLAIEREADYLPLIVQRINRRRDPVAAVIAQGDDAGLFDLLAVERRDPDPNPRAGEATAEKRYTSEGGTNFAMKPGRRYKDGGR